MKAVKTLQRYQCDFCKKRSVKHVIALHEKRCFRNPKRFCDSCGNTGEVEFHVDGIGMAKAPCEYCAKFDKKKSEEIDAYKKAVGLLGNEAGK